ncbi:MAG: cupin domain-containing protein [Alphaproteobacteria bacterium]|nr:cupin domain-containing protein [Alphaproteobacteria bacterium]
MTTEKTELLLSGYDALLFSYAAGNLDEAQSLAVATHLTFSEKARSIVRQCEDLGGALIEKECEPVSMCDQALHNVLSRIEKSPHTEACAEKCAEKHQLGFDIPKPLEETIAGHSVKWTTLFPGMKAYDLPLNCKQSVARFMKADPGNVSPHHHHGGTEITLVLDGAFSDEMGQYRRGDLIVADEECDHTPKACPERGCVCLVVTSGPIKLTGIASLLNPFLKP